MFPERPCRLFSLSTTLTVFRSPPAVIATPDIIQVSSLNNGYANGSAIVTSGSNRQLRSNPLICLTIFDATIDATRMSADSYAVFLCRHKDGNFEKIQFRVFEVYYARRVWKSMSNFKCQSKRSSYSAARSHGSCAGGPCIGLNLDVIQSRADFTIANAEN